MTRVQNRRAESQARALLTRAETMVARASVQLLNGEALSAMRLLRAADQLNQLDTRLRAKRAFAAREREAERALQQRERDCAQREHVLALSESAIAEQRAQLRQSEAALNAAYALMFAGPPPATGDETDSGVAPL